MPMSTSETKQAPARKLKARALIGEYTAAVRHYQRSEGGTAETDRLNAADDALFVALVRADVADDLLAALEAIAEHPNARFNVAAIKHGEPTIADLARAAIVKARPDHRTP